MKIKRKKINQSLCLMQGNKKIIKRSSTSKIKNRKNGVLISLVQLDAIQF